MRCEVHQTNECTVGVSYTTWCFSNNLDKIILVVVQYTFGSHWRMFYVLSKIRKISKLKCYKYNNLSKKIKKLCKNNFRKVRISIKF
jgi:hypothetical protein